MAGSRIYEPTFINGFQESLETVGLLVTDLLDSGSQRRSHVIVANGAGPGLTEQLSVHMLDGNREN